MIRASIPLDPDLTNGEVGELVMVDDLVTRHPDGAELSAEAWAQVRQQRQASGRPLHWWEVATHG